MMRMRRYILPITAPVIAIAALILGLGGCDDFTVYEAFPLAGESIDDGDLPPGDDEPVPQHLLIVPATLWINTRDSYTFGASGGTAPYLFQELATGNMHIDASTGVLTAPQAETILTIRVIDAVGDFSDATVHVVASGPLGISPATPSVEECGKVTFIGYGGKPPYHYSLIGDPQGSVHPIDGIYTAPQKVGRNIATVQIVDEESVSVATDITVIPKAPTDLTANGNFGGPQDILLTWTDSSACEDEYVIERKNGSEGMYWEIDRVAADETHYIDSDPIPFYPYFYRVRACAGFGADALESANSNEAFGMSKFN